MSKNVLILFIAICSNSFAQHWEDVNGGSNYVIQCMYQDTANDLLYVGGQFDSVGNISAHKIAVWDGFVWNSIGSNSDLSGNAEAIQAIVIFNNEIIIGGLFDSIGNIPAKNIARWNGQWNAMGNGFDGAVKVLKEYNGELYAGGSFIHSGNDTLNYISKWDGSNWMNINNGLDNPVSTMLSFKDTLIIGGSFISDFDGTTSSGSVIGYDGNSWISFNNGLPTSTIQLKIIKDTLFAVGSFSNNFTGIHYISKLVNNNWLPHPFPTGGGQPWVTDILDFNNKIYVCGFFTTPPDLASFNGNTFDTCAYAYGYINHIEVYKNDLYATGAFSALNNISFRNIAKYTFSDGVDEHDLSQKISFAYPNLLNREGHLKLSLPELIKYPLIINLYSATGRLIDSQKIEAKDSPINLPEIESGLYLLNCQDIMGQSLNTKVIIY